MSPLAMWHDHVHTDFISPACLGLLKWHMDSHITSVIIVPFQNVVMSAQTNIHSSCLRLGSHRLLRHSSYPPWLGQVRPWSSGTFLLRLTEGCHMLNPPWFSWVKICLSTLCLLWRAWPPWLNRGRPLFKHVSPSLLVSTHLLPSAHAVALHPTMSALCLIIPHLQWHSKPQGWCCDYAMFKRYPMPCDWGLWSHEAWLLHLRVR